MNAHALDVLEYDKVIHMLVERTTFLSARSGPRVWPRRVTAMSSRGNSRG